jgi:hypothetical protein
MYSAYAVFRQGISAKLRLAFASAFLILLAFALWFAFCRNSGSLQYEIYELQGNSEAKLLAKGTVEPGTSDVTVVEGSALGQTFWQKSVVLSDGFRIGASILREKSLDGFGLWIRRDDGGFSWNWLVREYGLTYRKLQGRGRVKATLAPNKDYEDLIAVEFLDDVTLTGRVGWFNLLSDTHQVVVKKGGVLRLTP